MNTTLSQKRRLKFTFFFKKKKKNSILKNPKVMLSSSTSKPTRSTFPLPTEVSYHRNQRKRNNSAFNHTSPRRKNMPHEIRIHPVAPDSPLSIVSNLTGDPALKEHSTAPQSFPLFSGGLPSLASPDDNASSFSMEDLYVSRQLFQAGDDDQNPFALQLERTKQDKTSFLATSKYFHKLVDWAFDAVDVDHSGQIDKKELYSGLILIHLKLASYLGPAACRPASRKHVYEIFDMIDFDNSGKLNRAEFSTIMLLFLSQIMTRVSLHTLMAIIIIPFLSRYTVSALVCFNAFMNQIFSEVKEARIAKETICQYVKDIYDFTVPYGIQQLGLKMKRYLEQCLTDEQTDIFAFTMMGILLGMILVPWILSQCDELYEYLASRKRKLRRK